MNAEIKKQNIRRGQVLASAPAILKNYYFQQHAGLFNGNFL